MEEEFIQGICRVCGEKTESKYSTYCAKHLKEVRIQKAQHMRKINSEKKKDPQYIVKKKKNIDLEFIRKAFINQNNYWSAWSEEQRSRSSVFGIDTGNLTSNGVIMVFLFSVTFFTFGLFIGQADPGDTLMSILAYGGSAAVGFVLGLLMYKSLGERFEVQ